MEGERGCASDPDLGGYDVLMPEPLDGASTYGYRVRLAEIGCDEVSDSGDFSLVPSDDMPDRTISVVVPNSDSIGLAGSEYTVEVRYKVAEVYLCKVVLTCLAVRPTQLSRFRI